MKIRLQVSGGLACLAPLSTYAAPLEEYEKHVTHFTEHVYQASMAIKAISFDRKVSVPETEAADLANLIFHESIDGAVWAYRLVSTAASKEPPRVRYEELRFRIGFAGERPRPLRAGLRRDPRRLVTAFGKPARAWHGGLR